MYDVVAEMTVSPLVRALEYPPECPDGACPVTWGMNHMRLAPVWRAAAAAAAAAAAPGADPALAATRRTAMVIDTGVAFGHFDFTASGTSIMAEQSVTFNSGRFAMSATPGFDDGNGHGTHVAGTMAAGWGAGDDARGIAGVTGRARVASCRFLADSGTGVNADATRCIQHATATKAFVINASYGGGTSGADYLATRQALLNFCASGGVFVAAAGNDGVKVGSNSFPANFAGQAGLECVVSVAALAANGSLVEWSNWGPNVGLAAPGHLIASDWIPGAGLLSGRTPPGLPELAGTNKAWATISGTSMAAPHVAGAVLLLGNAFPLATGLEVLNCLTSSAARRVSANPSNGAQTVGGGMADADAAYKCLQARSAGGALACSAERTVVRLRRNETGCDGLAAVPASAYYLPAAAPLSFSPAGPYAPGEHNVTVSASGGYGASCAALFSVLPCELECAGNLEVYQLDKTDNSCPAGLPLPSWAVWAPPGVAVSFDPPGPLYPYGKNVIAATPDDPLRGGCSVVYQINPCRIACPSVVTGSLRSGARCLESAPFPEGAIGKPAGVAVALAPAGPFFGGKNYSVVAIPSNNANICRIRLIMPLCVPPPTNCSAAPVVVDLKSAGRCPAPNTAAALPVGAVSAPPGAAVELSPAGPYPPGEHDVTATPDNGAPSCTVALKVVGCDAMAPPVPSSPSPPPPAPSSPSPPPPPPPSICAAGTQSVDLAVASGTNSCAGGATALPAGAVTAPAGATVAYAPPAPWKAGTWLVVATPSNGGKPCSVSLAVKACPPPPTPLACAEQVARRLDAATTGCDGAAVPVSELVLGAPAGAPLSAAPPGPYSPGETLVRVTAGSEACDARVSVAACLAACAPLTAPADLGLCSAASLPPGFALASSAGRTAVSLAATPPGPWPVGTTGVSVVALYDGGAVSAPSAACALTVADAQPPLVADTQACLYPSAAGRPYAPSSKCFGTRELLGASDNCGGDSGVQVSVLGCANVSPAGSAAAACTATATGVCVSLRNLPQGRSTPRVVRARLRATDAAGNSADATAEIRVFGRRGSDASCLRIARANARAGATPPASLVQRKAPPPPPQQPGGAGGGGGGGAPAPAPAPSPRVPRRGVVIRSMNDGR